MKDIFVDRFLKCTSSQGVVRLDFGRVESIDNDKNEIEFINKYLQYLSTLLSVLERSLIAEISQGFPIKAKFLFLSKASLNLLKGEAGPYLDLLSQFNKSSFE